MNLTTIVYNVGYVDYYEADFRATNAEKDFQHGPFVLTNTDRFIESRVFTRHFIKQ